MEYLDIKYWSDPTVFFYFNEDEREELKDLLREYDKNKVKKFISLVESDISFALQCSRERLPPDQKFKIEDMIKISKKLLAFIVDVSNGKEVIPPPRKTDLFTEKLLDDPWWRIIIASQVNAKKIKRPLQNFLTCLEEAYKLESRSKGRPNADKFNLAYQIARRFKTHLGQPRPYSGPYKDVIIFCFRILGYKEGSDISRAIRQALKKLSHP